MNLDELHKVMKGDMTVDQACEGMTEDFEIGHVSHRADGDYRKVAQGKWVPVKAGGSKIDKEFSDTENHTAQLERRKKEYAQAKRDEKIKEQRQQGEAVGKAWKTAADEWIKKNPNYKEMSADEIIKGISEHIAAGEKAAEHQGGGNTMRDQIEHQMKLREQAGRPGENATFKRMLESPEKFGIDLDDEYSSEKWDKIDWDGGVEEPKIAAKMDVSIIDWADKNKLKGHYKPEKNLTFNELYEGMKRGKDVDEMLGIHDSETRFRILDELANRTGKSSQEIQDLWYKNYMASEDEPAETRPSPEAKASENVGITIKQKDGRITHVDETMSEHLKKQESRYRGYSRSKLEEGLFTPSGYEKLASHPNKNGTDVFYSNSKTGDKILVSYDNNGIGGFRFAQSMSDGSGAPKAEGGKRELKHRADGTPIYESPEDVIYDMVESYNELARGDLQGVIEAAAMQHGWDENEILEEVDRQAAEKYDLNVDSAAGVVKKVTELAQRDYKDVPGRVLTADTKIRLSKIKR